MAVCSLQIWMRASRLQRVTLGILTLFAFGLLYSFTFRSSDVAKVGIKSLTEPLEDPGDRQEVPPVVKEVPKDNVEAPPTPRASLSSSDQSDAIKLKR